MSNALRIILVMVVLGLTKAQLGAVDAKDLQRIESTVNQDFSIQGEYVGAARVSGFGSHYVGLQVVALGEGAFDGVLYAGGLPGAGWDRRCKWQLTGTRQSQVATLVGQHLKVSIQLLGPGGDVTSAVLHRSDGCPMGLLRKVHRTSPTMSATAPYGATVLFDGRTPQHLADARLTDDGLLLPGASSKKPVGDFRLHMEFRTPFEPTRRGQGRGNSGVYVQRRYEVQILDSFGLEGAANECGGLYKQRPPDVNMCLPPLSWQTYDICFTAARWNSSGNKMAHARITLLHNGVVVHNNVAITNKTGNGRPEGPQKLPILWQDHRNPVHFRNLWIVHYDKSRGGEYAAAHLRRFTRVGILLGRRRASSLLDRFR